MITGTLIAIIVATFVVLWRCSSTRQTKQELQDDLEQALERLDGARERVDLLQRTVAEERKQNERLRVDHNNAVVERDNSRRNRSDLIVARDRYRDDRNAWKETAELHRAAIAKLRAGVMADKDALIAKKRQRIEELGRALVNCEGNRRRLALLDQHNRDLETQAERMRKELDSCDEYAGKLEDENRKFIEQLAQFKTEGERMYFEAEVPAAAYKQLKASIVGTLGGRVYGAHTHHDEMGG